MIKDLPKILWLTRHGDKNKNWGLRDFEISLYLVASLKGKFQRDIWGQNPVKVEGFNKSLKWGPSHCFAPGTFNLYIRVGEIWLK